jgi:hypothetical protein
MSKRHNSWIDVWNNQNLFYTQISGLEEFEEKKKTIESKLSDLEQKVRKEVATCMLKFPDDT